MKRHRLFLSESQFGISIVNFYENVAMAAGYTITDDTKYDCRKILVAENVFNGIIDLCIQQGYSRINAAQNIVIYGPKMNNSLKMNEVVIEDGFVVEGENE